MSTTQTIRRLALPAVLLATLLAPNATSAAMRGIPTPPHLTIIHGECPKVGGTCTDPTSATIYLSGYSSSFSRQHELAHLFDAQLLDDAERVHLTALLRASGAWDQGTGEHCLSIRCPSELFADAYAACRLGLDPRRAWTTAYTWYPSVTRHQRTCRAIARYGDASIPS